MITGFLSSIFPGLLAHESDLFDAMEKPLAVKSRSPERLPLSAKDQAIGCRTNFFPCKNGANPFSGGSS